MPKQPLKIQELAEYKSGKWQYIPSMNINHIQHNIITHHLRIHQWQPTLTKPNNKSPITFIHPKDVAQQLTLHPQKIYLSTYLPSPLAWNTLINHITK
jgi:hypothetical protein